MRLILTILGFLAAAVVFNVVADPYGTFFWVNGRFNHYKSEILSHWRTGKAMRVTLIEPDALVMGSSRVLAGIDPAHPAFAGYNAFNFGLPGANYCNFGDHLEQIVARQKVRRLVIGLDIFSANAHFQPPGCRLPDDIADPLLAFPRVLLSIDTFNSSQKTVFKHQNPDPNIWQPSPNGFAIVDPVTVSKQGGPRAAFTHFEDVTLVSAMFPLPACMLALEDPPTQRFPLEKLASALALAHTQGIDVALFLSPEHARLTAALDAGGLWPVYEAWHRGVINANERVAREAGRKPFPVWDFGGFNSVTTEPVPPASQKTGLMEDYWDASHYRKRVGDWMLDRIYGAGTGVPEDFGVRLTPENVAANLAHTREARDAWRVQYPAEYEEMRQSVERVRTRPDCPRRTS